ncbi:MAG TPA: hypothetical protein VFL45_03805 [Gammaproteobacteria bacterium]|jgi:hypothetical protein|nr:hypothetical protein [Gammaproteobacteria bacterium]
MQDVNTSSSIGDGVAEMKDQAREKTREMADEARRQATDTAERQKTAAADQVGGVASALRRTGEELGRQDQGYLADMASQFADSVDRFAGQLRDQDVGTLLNRTQEFARRRPGVFLAGAVATGFVLTRFLKSSGRREGDVTMHTASPDHYPAHAQPTAVVHSGDGAMPTSPTTTEEAGNARTH